MCVSYRVVIPNVNKLHDPVHFKNVQIPGLNTQRFRFSSLGWAEESIFYDAQVSKDQAGFVCSKALLCASHFVLKSTTVFF